VTAFRQRLLRPGGLLSVIVLIAGPVSAQSPMPTPAAGTAVSESFGLPEAVTEEHFTALKQHSPFLRTLDLSKSLIITGVARIGNEPVATLLDLESSKTSVVSRDAVNSEGWQLVEVNGNLSDIQTLTAKIKMGGGGEIFSIRYEKAPQVVKGPAGVVVSNKVGNGTPGGGTNPHGGPDPRVLTPDQMNDARNAARNIREGFKADGYGDNQTIPPEVVSKISRLSVEQRESINVKMYEYRNRGLGMPERQQIYNRLLDQAVGQR
jgi:hypothetical protein